MLPGIVSDQEDQDAQRVDIALEAMEDSDFSTAERVLLKVAQRAPGNYQSIVETADAIYVKSWGVDDFSMMADRHTASGDPRPMLALRNAYPRACYYLAFLYIEQGQIAEAGKWLDVGLRLEPDDPRMLLERALVCSEVGDLSGATRLYEKVFGLGESAPVEYRAAALRALGWILADTGELDRAEMCFLESQSLESGNEVADQGLSYVISRRAGGPVRSRMIAVTNHGRIEG
jgi:tetratricopeptide (TPR) repeat protein